MSAWTCCGEYNDHSDSCVFRTVGISANGVPISYLQKLESDLSAALKVVRLAQRGQVGGSKESYKEWDKEMKIALAPFEEKE